MRDDIEYEGRLIWISQGRCGGEPTFAHSRLSVRMIGGMLASGKWTREQVKHSYSYLTDDQLDLAEAIVMYAQAVHGRRKRTP